MGKEGILNLSRRIARTVAIMVTHDMAQCPISDIVVNADCLDS